MLEAKIWCDGGCRGNPGLGSAAIIARDLLGNLLAEEAIFLPEDYRQASIENQKYYYNPKLMSYLTPTNNMTEYVAIIKSLEVANELGLKSFEIISDSRNSVNQLQKENPFKTNEPRLIMLRDIALKLINRFENVVITHALRIHTIEADNLGNQCMDSMQNVSNRYAILNKNYQQNPNNTISQPQAIPNPLEVLRSHTDDIVLINACLTDALTYIKNPVIQSETRTLLQSLTQNEEQIKQTLQDLVEKFQEKNKIYLNVKEHKR